MIEITTVAALYRSEDTLSEFIQRCVKVSEELVGERYELILVDDGSPDKSFEIAETFASKNTKIKVIRLLKNYGQHQALFAGFKRAKGNVVFTLDADLEEPPEILEDFFKFLNSNEQANIVGAVQPTRKGKFFEVLLGKIFYVIGHHIFGYSPKANQLALFLMKLEVVKKLIALPNADLTLIGAINSLGFQPHFFTVKKLSSSATSYTFFSKLRLAGRLLLSHITKPIQILTLFSITLGFVSLGLILWLISSHLMGHDTLAGWSSTIIVLVFWGSFISVLQTFTLLILGEILNQQRGLKAVIEDQLVNFDE